MLMTDDQLAVRDLARRFAAHELRGRYQEHDKSGVLDRSIAQEMGKLGFLGCELPEEYGGSGAPSVTAGIIAEEIARGDFNVGTGILLSTSLLGTILSRSSNSELARHWVPKMVAGEAIVGLGITEPATGSDAANLKLRARIDGDDYVLRGEKTSITFATEADGFVVLARTGEAAEKARGITAIFVPGDAAGLSRTGIDDVGGRICGRGSLFFDDVRVPRRHRLGDEGKGFAQVMIGFDYSRAIIALLCIGAAQASLDDAWAYTQQRHAFGGPLSQMQGITFPLAEADAMIQSVRQLSYHVLELRDAGLPHTAEAAMVKWLGPKTAFETIHQCLLTCGHYGYSKELPHQQRLRDVMGFEIGDGTAGIMKLIVSRERLGALPASAPADARK
ncbi:cyclohexanecarboxyl-CoA dehydrogenase [Bradyrhizobium macuxiense]|uniref:Cyclohexanecarboxyl-CoA dehydrogenase n=1 Tax=Bradyrhizobium macuxiense TaxID=1755647 RepID=A0A560KXD7_9BRAD|nr:acyl-CoA dehydrogenase family protein [Bradyrhizobium macuxiense]TWB87779.1 cyclohexanecarboxyl-CoA dehydrogenase [Bradyrhizobium macuxiense]